MLDTNVWLDLLVFGDPRAVSLRAALEAGHVVAVTDDDCRDEWQRVLGYPLLRLDEASREAMAAAFDALAHRLPPVSQAEHATLPRCRDPDDQKFLQLAHVAGARWLLSRDRHLLSLARRCHREGWFEITTPESWAALIRM